MTFVTLYIQNFGKFLTLYKQSAVAKDRLEHLLQGADLGVVAEHHPLYLRSNHAEPEGGSGVQLERDRLKAIEVEGLTYRYPETGRGIKDITLRIERGSFAVITGRIGSGKTTLDKLLQTSEELRHLWQREEEDGSQPA